jgi:hypothetical protein
MARGVYDALLKWADSMSTVFNQRKEYAQVHKALLQEMSNDKSILEVTVSLGYVLNAVHPAIEARTWSAITNWDDILRKALLALQRDKAVYAQRATTQKPTTTEPERGKTMQDLKRAIETKQQGIRNRNSKQQKPKEKEKKKADVCLNSAWIMLPRVNDWISTLWAILKLTIDDVSILPHEGSNSQADFWRRLNTIHLFTSTYFLFGDDGIQVCEDFLKVMTQSLQKRGVVLNSMSDFSKLNGAIYAEVMQTIILEQPKLMDRISKIAPDEEGLNRLMNAFGISTQALEQAVTQNPQTAMLTKIPPVLDESKNRPAIVESKNRPAIVESKNRSTVSHAPPRSNKKEATRKPNSSSVVVSQLVASIEKNKDVIDKKEKENTDKKEKETIDKKEKEETEIEVPNQDHDNKKEDNGKSSEGGAFDFSFK